MTTDISTIAGHKLKNVVTGETVEMKDLWKDKNTAIFFFRRWGCTFCRLWAKEISEISPILHKNDVRVVGVSVEEVGSKEFVEGKYFDGELYYVEDRSTYNKLGFKRYNYFTILTSLFTKKSRDALAKSNRMKLGGDTKGDWVQIGGALFVKPGGALIKHFVQQEPAEHMPNKEILQMFNLEHEYKPEMDSKSRDGVTCELPSSEQGAKN